MFKGQPVQNDKYENSTVNFLTNSLTALSNDEVRSASSAASAVRHGKCKFFVTYSSG